MTVPLHKNAYRQREVMAIINAYLTEWRPANGLVPFFIIRDSVGWNVSTDAVRRALCELEKKGYIKGAVSVPRHWRLA